MSYVVDELKESGRQILFTGGEWWEYSTGAWRKWDEKDEKDFEIFLYRVASPREYPFADKKSGVWTTLRGALGATKPVVFDAEPMLVALNGTYLLRSGALHAHNPEHYATRRIAIDVDGDAECPLWLETLDRVFADYSSKTRHGIVGFIQEWMGLALVGLKGVRRDLRKAIILKGEKRSGKSSITDVLLYLLGGQTRVASPSITVLTGPFGLQSLIGKAALVTDEAASAKTQADADILKRLITGEPQTINVKNKAHEWFSFDGPVLFSTNSLPKVSEETAALYDRLQVINCNQYFSDDDADRDLKGYANIRELLIGEGEMPGILNWALEGYDRAIRRERFVIPGEISAATDQFRRQNDVVFDFLKSCVERVPRKAVASAALTIACQEYALAEHDKRLTATSVRQVMASHVRSVLPGVELDRSFSDKDQFRAYCGIALNERGLEMLQLAQGKPYPGLAKALKRVNYTYG